MNNRLLRIAQDLGKLYTDQAQIAIRISHLNDDLAARKLALVPAEGWEGKNAEARELAALRTFAADQPCILMTAELAAVKDIQTGLDAQIRALETERKAHEWGIRGALVSALRGETGETPAAGAVEETAFDTAADDAVDDQVTTDIVELSDAAYYETVVVPEMEAARAAMKQAGTSAWISLPSANLDEGIPF